MTKATVSGVTGSRSKLERVVFGSGVLNHRSGSIRWTHDRIGGILVITWGIHVAGDFICFQYGLRTYKFYLAWTWLTVGYEISYCLHLTKTAAFTREPTVKGSVMLYMTPR